MSVLCAVASVGFVMSASAAEQTMHGNLDEVVVEGRADVLPGGMISKTGSVGIIGDKDVMDVPFSTMSITQKQMETFGAPNMPLDNALVGVPSIRQAGRVYCIMISLFVVSVQMARVLILTVCMVY